MKYKRLLLYLFYMLFWIAFFELARLFFVLYNLNESANYSIWELFVAFLYGYKLDFSIVGYIGFFAIPIFIASAFFKSNKVLKISLNIYTAILLVFFIIIIIADAEVYKYWGFRLDSSPLQYLKTPGVVSASTSIGRVILMAVIFILYSVGAYFAYYHLVAKRIQYTINERFISVLYIAIAAVLIIPIRGGLGIVPINVGVAYHSDKMYLNHISINVIWNAASSLIAAEIDYDSYRYYDDKELEDLFIQAHNSPDSTIQVINTRPKHIVFIVLESFAKNAINFENPKASVTPKLIEWSKQGILFDNFYANGDRSEKGMVAIFSSTPPMPGYSITKDPGKSRHLPGLPQKLLDNAYKTSFYYGGDINFANLQSYLKQSGFQKVYSLNNLDLDCEETKWGYHDEFMFEQFYDDIMAEKDSSFHVLFTLSSHEPYDVPGAKPYGEKTESARCKNSYFYTDSCLNLFLNKMKASPIWDSTLIVLVSDHGTRYPGNVAVWDLPKFQIFMLWLGGAIDTEPSVYPQPGDQADISATLLAQLGIDHSEFIFSENMFGKYLPNAFYVFNHGYAFVKGVRWVIYDTNADKVLYRGWDSEKYDDFTKAYAQKLAEYYEGLGE